MGILEIPEITKEPRQRSISLDDIYLTKFISPWARPAQWNAEVWRWWVHNEPIAMICRETLIANVATLKWEIAPRKSDDREELRATINHYTKLLESGGDYYHGMDYTGLAEWLLTDFLDLPFGTGMELGRKGDAPNGRVMWTKPLDGGTLYPTLNRDYPVIQMYSTYDIVTFPRHTIARTYMSPRTEILREGWGLAPPEKIYFALMMLLRGDKYYADLLLDSPPSGILDLMDTEWDDALNWVKSLQEFYMGSPTSAMKIPVLAEHTAEAKFIPFGKVPNDIMFDKITLKYAAIVAAGYGMSLSDIGLQTTTSAGQTLAGSIRDEKKTKRTGYALAKKKLKYLFESFLPPTLQFNFIDLDDELNVALGRARLASATALGQLQDKGVISRQESRLVMITDGLFGETNLPEEPPAEAKEKEDGGLFGKSPERPGTLGRPEAASTGGQGEVRKMSSVFAEKSKHFDSHLKRFVGDMTKEVGQIVENTKQELSDDELYLVRSMVDTSIFSDEDALGIQKIIKERWEGKRWLKVTSSGLADELEKVAIEKVTGFAEDQYADSFEEYDLEEEIESLKTKLHRVDWEKLAQEFTGALDDSVKTFIGKSATYFLTDELLSAENLFDTEIVASDNNIVDKVYLSMSAHFDELFDAAVGMEVENLINKMIEEITK